MMIVRTEQLPPMEVDLEVEHECECALNLQKVFSEKVVDSVVDKVVHKIQKYVQPDVVEPDVWPKEHDVSKTGSMENIQQKHGIVRDVEHIADLQKFVSSPSQLKRAIGLNLEGEIKLEPEYEDRLEFTDEEVKAKMKIMFCNNIFALSTVLAKRCRKEKDVNVVEETLYSLDQTLLGVYVGTLRASSTVLL